MVEGLLLLQMRLENRRSFDEEPENNRQVHFNVPISILINGDLKFFAQFHGRDGMSTSWCMYCKVHRKD
jgi:hypothetical protein